MKRKLDKLIVSFLEKTPIKAGELTELIEHTDSIAWQAAIGVYLRFHDEALSLMRGEQLIGADVEQAKTKILKRLSVVWLGEDLK